MRLALHAEWTKLRTSPGTLWLLATVAVSTVGISAFAAATYVCHFGDCGVDPARLSLSGVQLGQAVVTILAVLVVGGEYATGMIRLSLAAMPRRGILLAAKASVLTAVVLIASAPAVVGSLIAGHATLGTLSFHDSAVRRAAFGSVLYLALIGLLALGVATAVRSSATATGVVLGLLYLFPIMSQAVSDEKWQKHLQQIGPMTAGLSIQATKNLSELPISPWKGLGVLALWAAGALLAGWVLLRQRDA